MKYDNEIGEPSDYYERKKFRFTWEGVIIGSLITAIACIFFADLGSDSTRPEAQEITEQLIKGDILKKYFEFVSETHTTPNTKYAKNKCQIENKGSKSVGYFTMTVVAWVKLTDSRPVRQSMKIFFEKEGEQPLVITKIEGEGGPAYYEQGKKP